MAAQLREGGSHPEWQNYQQCSTGQKCRAAFFARVEHSQQSFRPFASPKGSDTPIRALIKINDKEQRRNGNGDFGGLCPKLLRAQPEPASAHARFVAVEALGLEIV